MSDTEMKFSDLEVGMRVRDIVKGWGKIVGIEGGTIHLELDSGKKGTGINGAWVTGIEYLTYSPTEKGRQHSFYLGQRVIHEHKGPGIVRSVGNTNQSVTVELAKGNLGTGFNSYWRASPIYLRPEPVDGRCDSIHKPDSSKQESRATEYEYTHSAVLLLKPDEKGKQEQVMIPDPDDSWESVEEHEDFWPHVFIEGAGESSMSGKDTLGNSFGLFFEHEMTQNIAFEYFKRIAREKAQLLSYKKFRREVKEPQSKIAETYSGSEVLKSLSFEPKSECEWPKGGRPERKYIR